MLAERNKQSVDLDPVFAGKCLLQLTPHGVGAPRLHISPPSSHARDVYVDAYVHLVCSYAECEVRAFGSDAAKRREHFCIGRQLATKLTHSAARNLANVTRF